jgi:HK97 family phage major capsid protein
MDNAKQLLDEVKSGVISELKKEVGVMVADQTKALEKSLAEIKKPVAGEKAESQVKSLEAFKNKFQNDIYGKGLDSATPTAGKELVPEYYFNEVIRIAGEYGIARRNSRNVTMPAQTCHFPTMGSVNAYRVDEKAKITASAPTTGQVELKAKKLAGVVIATKELVQDANVDVMNYLAMLAGESIAKKEDEWAFSGLAGTEGIFRNTSAQVYAMGSGNTTYSSVTYDDIGKAMKLLDDSVVKNSIVLSSWDIAHGLRMEKDENGRYVLPQSPTSGTQVPFWGLPVVNSTVLPKSTDSGSQANKAFMAIYDPRYLFFGNRQAYELEFSKEATVTSSDGETTINLFEQDMVAIKVSERIDIKLVEPSKAFVMLKTSAT